MKHVAGLKATRSTPIRKKFNIYRPFNRVDHKNTHQAHCMIGANAYSLHNKKRVAFFLASHLLGGPSMSSRLNMALREKRGLAYHVECNYTPYLDTGVASVYFGTDASTADRCLNLVHKEIKKMREERLSTTELHQLKQQVIAQLAMAEESYMGQMQMMGKSLLDLDHIPAFDTLIKEVNKVSADHLQDTMQEVFAPGRISTLQYLPK